MRSVVPISGSVSPFMATLSVQPTARPEAKATSVPTEEAVHGVKAEDKTDMVETFSTVTQAIIVNVEKLVTHEEKEALEQLPLREQIPARIAAMDKEEIAAFRQVPEENSPVETVEMDGVEYCFFVLKGTIETEAGARSGRCGFREEEGAWIFGKLSVADIMK